MTDQNHLTHDAESPKVSRFGAGLAEADVRRFQQILEEDCGERVDLPEAWARAIELLGLVEALLTALNGDSGESPSAGCPQPAP